MGADGPGKAEIAVAIQRARIFCDEWEQASHGGELAAAVEAGAITRDDVTELGNVLTGEVEGRRCRRDHDLRLDRSRNSGSRDCDRRAERADELDLPTMDV
jgi:ornithine cyclodeaminase/alanine dehydrogenase-like protein (mu-crystallin family)